MMKPLVSLALGLALLIPVAASQANSLGDYPPPSDPCLADRQAAYTAGFNAGDLNGYNRGYAIGFSDGTGAGIARCFANPADCNISLASCLPDPDYGETEPNDNLIAADPLKFNTKYWAQSYGAADQDWFYIETTAANQNLALTFAVPNLSSDTDNPTPPKLLEGKPAVWNLTIRDAAGNVFANFDTNTIGSFITQDELKDKPYQMTYRATLGLVGTYYLVVQQSDKTVKNAYTYSIAASPLENTDLDGKQPIVGFYDAEVEPNDVPSRANPLATTVSMYGLINLTFNNTYPVPGKSDTDPDTAKWGQGDDDWYVYYSKGNEIITLTFCSKEECGVGDWYVEVYDKPSADALEQKTKEDQVKPLLSFNTNFYQCGDSEDDLKFCIDDDHPRDPIVHRLGLRDPGYYFMRVNHMRLFTAPCATYNFVNPKETDGFADEFCGCGDGGNSCYISTNRIDECNSGDLSCRNVVEDSCIPGVQPGCQQKCIKESTDDKGNKTCDEYVYWTTQALCACSQYGNVVVLPAVYTSPYNFTWHGTQLPTSTIDTDAYLDFLNRSNPYTP